MLNNDKVTVTADNVHLTNCAREQIHIPNAIQAQGCVIIVDPNTRQIIQVSTNTQDLLGSAPAHLIGSPLSTVLNPAHLQQIQRCSEQDFAAINPLRMTIHGQALNVIVHENAGFLFLEFEPADEHYNNDFVSFYAITRTVMDEMQTTQTFEELSAVVVRNIRRITGFDRVVVYRFDADGSGHVIAEDRHPTLEPFLGLHYPATDVPEPARRLYRLNYIRQIGDIECPAVPLPPHPDTGEPFDLSYATLRSVSPIHIEYLRNMGVRASMSISLLDEGELWGLIACHHYQTSKYLPYEVRTACEFLGRAMSVSLVTKHDKASLSYQAHIQGQTRQLINILSGSGDISLALLESHELLQSLVSAEGLAICINHDLELFGQTPTPDQITALVDWLRESSDLNFFATDRLSQLYEPATVFQDTGSGIMMMYLSRVSHSYILWFRPAIAKTVLWAGNPNKAVEVEADGTLTLSPRNSFAEWQETVKGHSQPWLTCEVRQIQELRNLLVDIIFKQAQELFELNIELKRSNDELDSFAYIASHDLKEPLRGVYNYSYLLLEDYGEQLDEDGSRKLNMLMNLTKRMEKLIDALLYYSRLGRQNLILQTIDIESIINADIKPILEASQQETLDLRIPHPIPKTKADKTLTEEVFMNLITNGLKYNKSEHKWIEIGHKYDLEYSSEIIFYVKDNGIGIAKDHQEIIFRIFKRLHGQQQYGGGTGAGLTIVKKIIERHGGKIWVESQKGAGTTFYFTLSKESNEAVLS